MRFEVTDEFPCRPAQMLLLFDEPDLEARIAQEAHMTREVVEQVERPDGTRLKRVRCRPIREVPAFVRKWVGSLGLQYDEVNETDPRALLVRWHIEVPAFSDRIRIGGTSRFTETVGGCTRFMQGDVEIAVPLVGPRVEKLIVDDVVRSVGKTAEAARRYAAERVSGSSR